MMDVYGKNSGCLDTTFLIKSIGEDPIAITIDPLTYLHLHLHLFEKKKWKRANKEQKNQLQIDVVALVSFDPVCEQVCEHDGVQRVFGNVSRGAQDQMARVELWSLFLPFVHG
jgi:hypothetical protein